MRGRTLVIIGIIVGIVVLYFLLDFLIKTDKERLNDLLQESKTAVAQGKVDVFLAQVSPDYRHQEISYEKFVSLVTVLLKKFSPMQVRVMQKDIVVSGDIATITVQTFVTPDPGGDSQLPGLVKSRWRLGLEKKDDKWVIYQVECIGVGDREGVRIQDIINM